MYFQVHVDKFLVFSGKAADAPKRWKAPKFSSSTLFDRVSTGIAPFLSQHDYLTKNKSKQAYSLPNPG